VGALTVLVGLSAGTAQAAPPTFHCEASALRAQVDGQPAIEPMVTGREADCATAAATPSVALPALLQAQALIADTTYDGTGSADGGIAHLAVLPTPDLIARLPTEQFIDQLPTQTVDVPAPLAPVFALLGLPSKLQLDLRDAVRALVPAPNTALVSVDLLNAHAAVSCQGGVPALSGSSQVAGVKLLGNDVGVDGVVSQALTVLAARHISPADLDPTKITILSPLTGLLPAQVQQLVSSLTAQLPAQGIDLPASIIDAQLAPGEQITDGATLTQRALHAHLALGGQPVLDAVLGEAQVGAVAGTCTPAPVAPAPRPRPQARPSQSGSEAATGQGSVTQQILACTDRKLVLVDVLERGGRVKLLGAADRKYVGRKVAIRLRATGRIVAHATVHKDGSFETTAPRPARVYFATHKRANRVRYRAEIGKELSLPLKLQRRLIVSSLSSKNGRVTIAGRVVAPLTTPRSEIRVVRRVSCHKVVLVKRFKPRPDGTFRVTVKAPKGQAAAVYRLKTYVREKPSNPRRYPTFTLPRGVALNTR
jgi:hypothetical protein